MRVRMRMRGNRRGNGFLIWFLIVLVLGNLGMLENLFSARQETGNQTVTEDLYMSTDNYFVDARIDEHNTVTVTEDITVTFEESRHGIYRYIPYKGVITEHPGDALLCSDWGCGFVHGSGREPGKRKLCASFRRGRLYGPGRCRI